MLQPPTSPGQVPTLSSLSQRACSKPRASRCLWQCDSLADLRAGSESPPAFRTVTSPQNDPPRRCRWTDPLSDTLLQCQSMLELHRSGSESPPVFWGPMSTSSRSSLGGQPRSRCSMARSCASTCEPSGTASPRSRSQSPGCAPPATSDQRTLRRALQAELSLLEKDRRIESLEARIRELEDAAHHHASVAGQSSLHGGSTYATAADVEALCRKTGDLVERLASLRLENDVRVETRYQRQPPLGSSRVAEESGRRLIQLEAQVQQKLRPIGSHLTRNLCSGPHRSPPRFRRASSEI